MSNEDAIEDANDQRPKLHSLDMADVKTSNVHRLLSDLGLQFGYRWPRMNSDMLAGWGRSKSFTRAKRFSEQYGLPLVTLEDGFLRSVRPAHQGEDRLSLVMDETGIYYDNNDPGDLESLILEAKELPASVLERAELGMTFLREEKLSQINAFDEEIDIDEPYVLVVDEPRGRKVQMAGSGPQTFLRLLALARREHPRTRIIVKAPNDLDGPKAQGHIEEKEIDENTEILSDRISSWDLIEGAEAIYCVGSMIGFEAIIAGKRPITLGLPFYHGWGLSDDRNTNARIKGQVTALQMFHAVFYDYNFYYDPYRQSEASFEECAIAMTAFRRAWSDEYQPILTIDDNLAKAGFAPRLFSNSGTAPQAKKSAQLACEAATEKHGALFVTPDQHHGVVRTIQNERVPVRIVEQGFLGIHPPHAKTPKLCSAVLDRKVAYWDPSHPSELESLIAARAELSDLQEQRISALVGRIIEAELTKYKVQARNTAPSPNADQKVILIAGQREGTARFEAGCLDVTSNEALIWTARQTFPNDYLVFKPHPLVEAGKAQGAVNPDMLRATVDLVAQNGNIAWLVDQADFVVTINSQVGFDALIRGKEVLCLGAPFYAGWGLTHDAAETPARRTARPSIEGLAYACLVDYCRYWDPVTELPCSPELLMDRVADTELKKPSRTLENAKSMSRAVVSLTKRLRR